MDGGDVESREAYFKAIDKQGFGNMLRQRGHDVSFLESDFSAATTKPEPAGAQRPLSARK